MPELTAEGRRAVEELARQQSVSEDAVRALLVALVAGGGTMAQFNHSEFGGLGQWSQGGMTMLSNMFDHGLKARVDTLCWELSRRMRATPLLVPATPAASSWPAEFGAPSSSGSQGDMRYAYFPEHRRLVLQQGGRMTIHDTADHRISGVSQQQGGGQSLTFTSQHGPVRLADLPVVGAPAATATAAAPAASTAGPATATTAADPLAQIERLAELHKKGILTEAEFVAKKTELLGRL